MLSDKTKSVEEAKTGLQQMANGGELVPRTSQLKGQPRWVPEAGPMS
jgi:hypothetical protein